MNVNFMDAPTPRIIRTIFYVHTRRDGLLAPFYEDFPSENQAKAAAEKKAKGLGLPLIFVDWKTDLKDVPGDGVFLCAIRRDEAQPLSPRVFT